MKLEQALKRVGATVVKTTKRKDDSIVLLIRIRQETSDIWATTISEFILASVDAPWSQDVSKSFFAADGHVKYLWRVILMQDVAAAAEALGKAAIRATASSVEVKSMPLIGRATYAVDPSRGKTKGFHDSNTADAIVAHGFGKV